MIRSSTARAKARSILGAAAAIVAVAMAASPAAASAQLAPMAAAPTLPGAYGAARAVDVPIFDEDRVLTLPRSTQSFWFLVPGGARLDGAELRLGLSCSDALIDERSTLTVLLNGDPLATTAVRRAAADGIWVVPIPVASVRADGSLNELRFASAHRSIEGDCADIDNPANWVRLSKASAVRLTVADGGPLALRDVYPRFFDALDRTGALSAEFVLDGAPKAEAAMLRLAAAIGAAYPYRDAVSVGCARAQSAASGNVLRLGGAPAPGPGAGYLAVDRSGGADRLAISGDAEGFEKAVALASDPALMALADGSEMVVRGAVPAPRRARAGKASGHYTLGDFGYDGVILRGAFHQQASFALPQPGALVGGSRSYVEIHFRHAEALVPERSLMTVYVGGVPLGSAKLSPANASGGKIKVPIPEDALQGDVVEVRVEVYNDLGRLDCSKDYDGAAWTAIDRDSVVYYEPGEAARRPTLDRFPALAAGNTVVVLPGDASDAALGLAAALAVRAGQVNGGADAWRVQSADALEAPDPDADYLFLSDAGRASLPEAVLAALPAAPAGGGRYAVAAGVRAVEELLAGKALFQAIRSPWNFDRRAYVITYPEGAEALAAGVVARRGALNRFSGQLAVSGGAGGATALALGETARDDDPPLTLERAIYLIETRTGYPIEALIALAAALLVILILLVRNARHRNRFGAAARDVERENRQKRPGGGAGGGAE